MSKLTETMAQHPEMSPEAITRIEVRKVAEPTLRAALEAIVDLIEIYSVEHGPLDPPQVMPTDPVPPADPTPETPPAT